MTPPRLMTEGFRFFFLAAALWAVMAVLAWEGWLGVHALNGMVTHTPFAPAPHLWHAHEMVFGYGTAVLGGFFLTAVPNWTGGPGARAGFVIAAAALWLAGRLAVWFSGGLPPALVAAVDLAFLPLLAAKIAALLAKRPKPQNVALLGLIALVWAGNLWTHLEWTGVVVDGASPGLRLGLSGLCALIAVVGGRVTPAFTRNAMTREGRERGLPVSRPWLELPAIVGAVALGPLWAFGAPEPLLAAVALVAGAAQLGRVAGWRPGWALRQPILWSLHAGMAMLGLGWLALGAGWAGAAVGESAGLHLLAIGAVGGMTLAVMSRAALGHTGRPLATPAPVAWAYALVLLAALLRFGGPVFAPGFYNAAVLGSGALWIAAFAIFAAVYAPILTGPRVAA
jgi:uncharacterized protein involved in response to NO